MNVQTPGADVARKLVGFCIRLPLYAERGRIYDADGDYITSANPAGGMSEAQHKAQALVQLVNAAVASAAPVPAEVGFCSAEAL